MVYGYDPPMESIGRNNRDDDIPGCEFERQTVREEQLDFPKKKAGDENRTEYDPLNPYLLFGLPGEAYEAAEAQKSVQTKHESESTQKGEIRFEGIFAILPADSRGGIIIDTRIENYSPSESRLHKIRKYSPYLAHVLFQGIAQSGLLAVDALALDVPPPIQVGVAAGSIVAMYKNRDRHREHVANYSNGPKYDMKKIYARAEEHEGALKLRGRPVDGTLAVGQDIPERIAAGNNLEEYSADIIAANLVLLDSGFHVESLDTKVLDGLRVKLADAVETVNTSSADNSLESDELRHQRLDAVNHMRLLGGRMNMLTAELSLVEGADDGQRIVVIGQSKPARVVKNLIDKSSDAENFIGSSWSALVDLSISQKVLENIVKGERQAEKLKGYLGSVQAANLSAEKQHIKTEIIFHTLRIGATWLAIEHAALQEKISNAQHDAQVQADDTNNLYVANVRLDTLRQLEVQLESTEHDPDAALQMADIRKQLQAIKKS